MVNKTGGTARIWGFDIALNPRNSKNSIGIVPQEIVFDPFFTPFETLENQAGFYGVPKAQRRTMELLRAVHLEDKANAYARTLSGGIKRRLLVAKAMLLGRESCRERVCQYVYFLAVAVPLKQKTKQSPPQ